ncbi:MAG TPA: kelch repeat-containing protein, partial [Polyangia bacterium]|nr:kelch repeat-containing protein [Polyangia bacterium]
MKARHGVLALLVLNACTDQADESTTAALGVLPSTESATWKRVGASNLPDARYAQAVAFDETRQVVVMFGGMVTNPDGTITPQQDTWEWSPALGAWKVRTIAGAKPSARSGAALAYDSVRSKFVLFGGRAGSGYDYQDTWEWDPGTGAWTDKTRAGAKPDARAQHGMIFDSKAGTIVLFGGGRSMVGGDVMTVSLAFDDTWEYDGASATWTKLATASAPSARVDFGFAYSGQTNKAYLFGGMEVTSANMGGTPTQDSWEWDSAAGTWTETTSTGDKPSPRFGHGMAIDSSKGQATVFGGYDMATGYSLNDVWYWDLAAGTWTVKQPSGSATWPTQRQWSPLVFCTSTNRMYVVAGYLNDQGSYYGGTGGMGGVVPVPIAGYPYYSSGYSGPSREVWELDPATTTWANRSAPSNSPGPRTSHAMAADQVTGKVYVFGGQDDMGNIRDDLWEWNGDKWVECQGDIKPSARMDTAMAYDPARKSLILFGGSPPGTDSYYGYMNVLADTWEWNTGTRKWAQLAPALSPSQRSGHGMVTDSGRKKIILYAGYDSGSSIGIYPPYPPSYYPDAGVYTDPNKTDVWEWDGASGTWTNRTPTLLVSMPAGGYYPIMVFDEGRKKLTLFQLQGGYYGYGYAAGDFWEWDPAGGAWSQKVTGEALGGGINDGIASYDSIRRRVVLLGLPMMSSGITMSTWELDTSGPTWYARPPSGEPSDRWNAGMAFDNQRGVVVLFGGSPNGTSNDETWEYSVTGRGNGTGCTAATASLCASGNCVDGVCCESASCSGPCKSCNVPGKAGTCVLAAPGTQVAGSCSGDQACDGSGSCKAANGAACASAAACASGFCTDGSCCTTACTGTCVSCKLAGKVGTCSPIPIGTDPENECGKGTPPCQSTCDGVGACVFPTGSACGTCGTCSILGSCVESLYCTAPNTNTRTASLTTTATTTGSTTLTITLSRTSTGTGTTGSGTATSTGSVATATRTTSGTGITATVTATGTSPTGTVTATSTTSTGTRTNTGTGVLTGTGILTGTGVVTGTGV